MLPNERYFQITNLPEGISFESDYKVEIIDNSANVLKDVTDNVFIEEYIGTQQIGIEIVDINQNFYGETCFLKFTHTLSDVVYYSNPLTIHNHRAKESSYFMYKNENDFMGIVYSQAQKYQSIRLRCYFNRPETNSENEEYYQVSDNRISSGRPSIKHLENYVFKTITPFIFYRLDILLNHEYVYLNGVRCTNKPQLSNGDNLGGSNVFNSDFSIGRDYSDTLSYTLQLFEGLQVTQYYPTGYFTLNSLPSELQITANTPIQLSGNGSLRVYDASDNSVLATYTTGTQINDYTIQFTDDLGSILISNGSYYVLFDNGFIESQLFNLTLDGNLLAENWSIEILNAAYDSNYYDSNYYLTD